MDAPKKQTKKSLLNSLNKQLNAIGTNVPLQQWLDEAAKISKYVATALDGMYCGHDGKINEEVIGYDYPIFITMGWHTVTTARVEYAYFS
jgi:hypothetical protein